MPCQPPAEHEPMHRTRGMTSNQKGIHMKRIAIPAVASLVAALTALAAASRAADRSELRPLAWIFTVLVMLINVPIAFRGGLYSWVLILIAVGILWLPVYTDVLDD